MFLAILDPDPDSLVRGKDPDPSIIKKNKQNSKENLNSNCFVTSLRLLSLKNDVNVASKSHKQQFLVVFLKGHWRKYQNPDRIRIR
jgi:hypothetical protein